METFTDYDLPENGYYRRMLEDNGIQDNYFARQIFTSVADLFWYHGEEYLEKVGNSLVQTELQAQCCRLVRITAWDEINSHEQVLNHSQE